MSVEFSNTAPFPPVRPDEDDWSDLGAPATAQASQPVDDDWSDLGAPVQASVPAPQPAPAPEPVAQTPAAPQASTGGVWDFLGDMGRKAAEASIPGDPQKMATDAKDIEASAVHGWNTAQQGAAMLGSELGVISPETAIRSIVEDEADKQKFQFSDETKAAQQAISDAEGPLDALTTILQNPRGAVTTFVQSAPLMAGSIAGGVVGGLAGGATPLGPAGALGGMVAGAGAMSGASEYATSLLEAVQEAGYPVTNEGLTRALADQAVMAAAREKALKRGAIIGTIDGLSMGLAGKFLPMFDRLAEAGRISRPTAAGLGATTEAGAQAVMGGGGEALAQIATDGKVTSWGDVMLEGLLEVPGSAVEVPAAIATAQAAQRAPLQENGVPQGAVPAEDIIGADPSDGTPPPAAPTNPLIGLEGLNAVRQELSPEVQAAARKQQLENLLNDPRPLEEIKAEQAEQERQAQIAAQQPQVDAVVAQTQATAPQQVLDQVVEQIGGKVTSENMPDYLRLLDEGMKALGTRSKPIDLDADPSAVNQNAHITAQPTPGQAEAGNYQKRRLKWQGFKLKVETEKGAERTAVDGSWSVTMPDAYGDFEGIKGADGDDLDFYMGPNPQAPQVFVIDQVDADSGKFDEHKVMVGYASPEEAVQAYHAGFSDGRGPDRLGAVKPMSVAQFKAWARNGDKKKPVAYTGKAPAQPQNRPAREPKTLLQHIAAQGGLANDDAQRVKGELRARDVHNHFIPGWGKLVRKGGIDLDKAREMAVERGYLPAGASIDDLLNLIEQEARYRNPAQTARDGWANLANEQDPAEREYQARSAIVDALHDVGLTDGDIDAEALSLATESVINGETNLLDAYEGAIRYLVEQNPAIATAMEEADIPFFSEPTNEQTTDQQAGPGSGEDRQEDGQPHERPGEVAADEVGAGAGSDRDGQGADGIHTPRSDEEVRRAVTAEEGADGKPQLVIPGAEQISQAQQAQRQAEKPLQASKPQQAMDEGLFGDGHKQQDIFDTHQPAKPAAQTEASTPKAGTFEAAMSERLLNGPAFNSIAQVRQFAKQYGITDPKALEERIELLLVQLGRQIVDEQNNPSAAYDALVDLYNRQPKLGTRTSTSVANQAYSTPLPLAYIASRLAQIDGNTTVYEPSAGNGALLIGAEPRNTVANEIEELRNDNLEAQGFNLVGDDAADSRTTAQAIARNGGQKFDAIIANPPFGVVRDEQNKSRRFKITDRYSTNEIDHAISFEALEAMKDDGSAVLILGGVTKLARSEEARSDAYNGKAKREFFYELYRRYNVVDHFTVAGELYEKQGAGWPVDVIVIRGRGQSARQLPAVDVPRVLTSWDQVKGLLDARYDEAARPTGGASVDSAGSDERAGSASRDGADRGELPEGRPDTGTGSREDGPGGAAGLRPGRDRGQRGASGAVQPGSAVDARTGAGEQGSGANGADVALSTSDIFDQEFDALFGDGNQALQEDAADRAEELPAELQAKLESEGVGHLAADLQADRAKVQEELDTLRTAVASGKATASDFTIASGSLRYQEASWTVEYFRDLREQFKGLQDAWKAGLPLKITDNSKPKRSRKPKAAPQPAAAPIEAPAETYTIEGSDEDGYRIFKNGKLDGQKLRYDTRAEAESEIAGYQAKTAGQAAASAVKNAIMGLDEVASGLSALFGDPTRFGSGPVFDEDTYAKAVPLFKAGVAHFREAANDVAAMVRALLKHLNEVAKMPPVMIQRMKPYIVRFIDDVKAGTIQLFEEVREKAADALDAAAEKVSKPKPRIEDKGAIDTSARQVAYRPRSNGNGMGTLVPVNMQTSIQDSLKALEKEVGDIDAYVARELGVPQNKLNDLLGAEQIDGVALGIYNFSKGSGFIVGDQTGIGKGRQVAAILRWAMRNGKTPIFVTEKPNLYADMYRDLVDVGVPEMLGRDLRILMTNSGETVPLDDEGKKFLKSQPAGPHGALLKRLTLAGKAEGYDAVFTTYNQMQTIKEKETDRMRFLRAIAGNNAVLTLDEAHNAGGQAKSGDRGDSSGPPTRADFARELTYLADAVLYSSATFAKRPDVMDLYFKTDMRYSVANPDDLGPLIAAGGVPMQQIVSAMLSKAGQYVRRERSFDGVKYDTPVVPVDRTAYESFSGSIKLIQEFSEQYVKAATKAMDKRLKAEAKKLSVDNATGGAGASSTNFTSIMHNVINQLLLASKAEAAADAAIESLKNGEKPVITLASTLESFITEYAEEHGLKPGDAINISFGDLLNRYLDRSRYVIVKPPNAVKGESERIWLTNEDLGPAGVAAYKRAKDAIRKSQVSSLPVSPIDFIRARIKQAGFTVGEITGRGAIIDYRADGTAVLAMRPGSEMSIAGRRKAISDFNNGKLDVMILNQAGSTGLSLHASERVKDQRKRHMIIAQAEGNIDTHMQMLGRVHRTGQVVTPRYSQLIADVPAEKRPAAVLAKKMASLNASTTAARDSAVTAKDVPDFMNEYGDRVAAAVMNDNPELHGALGDPLPNGDNGLDHRDAMRKITGRIPLLPLAQQETLYSMLESEYEAYIEQLEATGQNGLEAKTLELDAKLIDRKQVKDSMGVNSPFADGVYFETMDVKRLGKPFSKDQVIEKVVAALGNPALQGEHSLKDLAQMGFKVMEPIYRDAERDFKAYKKEVLDDIEKPETRAAQEHRLDDVKAKWFALSEIALPGQGVKLMAKDGNFYGVVLKVERTGKTKNPLALGSWKVTVALADSARQITIPFSALYLEHTKPDNIADNQIQIDEVWSVGSMPLLDAFDDMQTERRETRIIVTGNLLAGYDFVKGRGNIANFVDAEHGLRQGIILPRDFDPEKFLGTAPVAFRTPEQIVRFLERVNKAIIRSTDDLASVRLAPSGDIDIRTDAGRGKGGKYFLNKAVLEATGQDFVKVSGEMRAIVPPTRAVRAMSAMMQLGAQFQTRENLEEARAIAGDTGPEYSALPEGPLGPILEGYEGDWKGAALELERLQSGEAPGALHHPDVGPIALVWGYAGTGKGDGYGLSKMIAYHPEMLDDLQGRISAMEVKSRSDNRINLRGEHDQASVRLEWDGQAKVWFIGGYDRRAPRRTEKSTASLRDLWGDLTPSPRRGSDKDSTGEAKIKGGSTPTGWDAVEAIEFRLPIEELEEIDGIIARVAGLDTFETPETIVIPGNSVGAKQWGKTEDSRASGSYSAGRTPAQDVIEIALDSWEGLGRSTAYHESFHRLQTWFLTDQERRLLKAANGALRAVVAAHEGRKHQAAAMSQREVEAEAFAIYMTRPETRGIPARVRNIFAKIARLVRRVKSWLDGHGYQTWEDVFERAGRGEIAQREPSAKPNKAGIEHRERPDSPVSQRAPTQGLIAKGQFVERALRVPFDLFGGVDRNGQWNPAKALHARAKHIIVDAKIDPNGTFGWLHSPVENTRRGLIDRYGLDDAYVKRERRTALDKRGIMAEGQAIMEHLADNQVGAAEAKVLQAILTGETVDNDALNRLAAPIRVSIDQLGEEAVQLGLISRESFERNRGSYLHRVYMKDQEEANALARFVGRFMERRRKRIIGDQMKGRGIFLEVPMQRLVSADPEWAKAHRGRPFKGEKFHILDYVPGTSSDLLSGEMTAKATRRVFWPADRPIPAKYQGQGWTDKGVFEVRGDKNPQKMVLWRDYSKAERERMGEILDARYTIAKTYMLMANDLATGRFFKDVAENEAWTSTQEPGGRWVEASEFNRYWNDPAIEWVKVPETTIADTGGKKKWGALAGKWVRAEIWKDLNETVIMDRPSTWRTLLTQWKLNKTARNPVVHMNNIMSNFVFMDLADVRIQDFIAGLDSYIREDEHYQDAARHGAFGSDLMSQELREKVLKPLLDELRDQQAGGVNPVMAKFGALGKIADFIWTGLKGIDERMISAYQMEDEVFRMATYRRRRALGHSPEEAADFARTMFIDYDIKAPWVNAARNTLLPFISYTYRAIPLVAEAVATRPWKLAKYFALFYVINALAYAFDDDDDEERERAAMRKEEQGKTWLGMPRMIRMPWSDANGLPVFLDVRRWVPAGDVFDTNQGQSAIGIPAWLQAGGPILLAFEFFLNKQAFTGKPITNDLTDTTIEKAGKVADWGWKSWAPNAPWIPGSYSWEKIGRAARGAEDPATGDAYSMREALLSTVGIKAKPLDVERAARFRLLDFQRERRALEDELKSAQRQKQRRILSDDEFEKVRERVKRKIERVSKEQQEFQKLMR